MDEEGYKPDYGYPSQEITVGSDEPNVTPSTGLDHGYPSQGTSHKPDELEVAPVIQLDHGYPSEASEGKSDQVELTPNTSDHSYGMDSEANLQNVRILLYNLLFAVKRGRSTKLYVLAIFSKRL